MSRKSTKNVPMPVIGLAFNEKAETITLVLDAKGEKETMLDETQLTEEEIFEEAEAENYLTPEEEEIHPGKRAADKRAELEQTIVEQETLNMPPAFELVAIEPGKVHELSLLDLITLDSTPIDGAVDAMRVIDKAHLEHMTVKYQEGVQFPPVKIVFCKLSGVTKAIVVDGGHRWKVYDDSIRNRMKAAGNQSVTALTEARKLFKVQCLEIPVKDEFDLLDKAYEANLEHGLPASTQSRCRYAIFRMMQSKRQYPDNPELWIGRNAAAKLAGVFPNAITQQIARDKLKNARGEAAKMVDTVLSPDDLQEVETLVEKQQKDTLSAAALAAEKLTKAIVSLGKDTDLQSPGVMADFLRPFVDTLSISQETLRLFAQTINQLAQKAPKAAALSKAEASKTVENSKSGKKKETAATAK